MDALRQQPRFGLDHEARAQLRETRASILQALNEDPDNFKALVLADVVGELDPDRDPALAAHRMRFRATREASWRLRAKELGLDRLLFHIAHGWRAKRIGTEAVPILERRAAELGEARPEGVTLGHIDASYVPAELSRDRRVAITYHASGHLHRVAIEIDELHHGELVLAERPGAGRVTIVEKRGGYGTMIAEAYRDGSVVTTLNTPWHDGEESIEPKPWTRWVEENLAALAHLTRVRASKRKQGGKPRRR